MKIVEPICSTTQCSLSGTRGKVIKNENNRQVKWQEGKRGGRKTSFNPQPSKIVGYFFLFIIRKINSSWRPADSLERRALDATPTISSIFSIFSAPFHRVRMGRYSSLLYSLCCTHYTEIGIRNGGWPLYHRYLLKQK